MNKHTKLFVAFLFVVLVILVIATISFSVDISKNSAVSQEDSLSETVSSDGRQIFQGDNGMFGLEDANGNTLIDAQWEHLQFLTVDYLAATTETEDGERIGVLDLDGNIAAPFVYQEIQTLLSSYYVASLADSDQYVLYDSAFRVLESTVWDDYTCEDTGVTLTKDEDVFYFTLSDDGLALTEIALSRTSGEGAYEVDWADADASLLSVEEWSCTADMMQQLLAMILSDDFTSLMQITDQNHEESILASASQEDHTVLRFDRTAYVSVSKTEEGTVIATWQIDASVHLDKATPEKQTITVTMKKNKQQVLVVTELQFA